MSAATLNGALAHWAEITIPRRGVWSALAETSEAIVVGPMTIAVGELSMAGTAVEVRSFRDRTLAVIRGGAGAWTKVVRARSYRNDAGVKASTVLSALATETGETIGTVVDVRLGPAFVRASGPASGVLRQLWGDDWHVDNSGTTQKGARATTDAEIVPLHANLAAAFATVGSDELADVVPGATCLGRVVGSVVHVVRSGRARSNLFLEAA